MAKNKDPMFIVTEVKRVRKAYNKILDILDNSQLYVYEKLGLLEVVKFKVSEDLYDEEDEDD